MVNRKRIVFFYLIISTLWIIFSDQISITITNGLNIHTIAFIQSSKGLFFIIVTGASLNFLIKKHDKTLNDSHKQYKYLFDANPHPMWIYNVHSLKFVDVNDAAIKKYGYSREEFLSMSIKDIRSEDYQSQVMEAIKSIGNTLYTSGLLWAYTMKSGEKVIVFTESHAVNFKKQECVMVLASDVTEKINYNIKLQEAYKVEKELNQKLEEYIEVIKKSNEENRKLAEIVNAINNPIIIMDIEGKTTWVNKAFTEFTGYTLSEISGRVPGQFLFGPKTNEQTVQELIRHIRDNNFFTLELISYKKNGEDYWVQINISPLLDEAGNRIGSISVENIITERKKHEAKINAQNLLLREIAWVSSHEVRRPVASILSLSSLIKDAANKMEIEEYLEMLDISSKELDTIIKDITRKINLA